MPREERRYPHVETLTTQVSRIEEGGMNINDTKKGRGLVTVLTTRSRGKVALLTLSPVVEDHREAVDHGL